MSFLLRGFPRGSLEVILVSIQGLTSGEARPGDHATITATMSDASSILTYAWGSALDGTQYGTGTSPTDYTAGDGGDLFLTVTTSEGTYRTSAPIRYAVPAFSVQPTLDQATYNVGNTVTLTEGTAGPGATLTIEQFTIDGVDVSGQLVGLTWDTTGRDIYGDAGLIELQVRATNSGGFVLSTIPSATLRDVPEAFVLADWAAADGGAGDIDVTINSLPDDGNTAITDIEYRIDTGTWVSSGGTVGFTVLGLSDGSTNIELRAVNAVGAGAASDVKAVTVTGGAGAVTINSVTVGGFSAGELPIVLNTVETPDNTSTVYFVLVPQGSGAPSAAQIKLGQQSSGAAASDDWTKTWTATPTNHTIVTGLDAFFDLYCLIDNGADSNIASDLNFEVDSTNPGLTLVTGTQTGATTADWGATSDEAAQTIFAAVRLNTDPALTKTEIENGTGNAVATDTDATPTADANNGGAFTGLTASTTYVVDAFQRDEFGNESGVATSSSFTTAAASSYASPSSDGAVFAVPQDGIDPSLRRVSRTWLAGRNYIAIGSHLLSSPAPTSVTANGVTAALVPGADVTTTSGDGRVLIYAADIVTGGTGDLDIQFAANTLNRPLVAHVWTATDSTEGDVGTGEGPGDTALDVSYDALAGDDAVAFFISSYPDNFDDFITDADFVEDDDGSAVFDNRGFLAASATALGAATPRTDTFTPDGGGNASARILGTVIAVRST